MRGDDESRAALANGTAELEPPPSKTDVPALPDAADFVEDRDERTKVDVQRARRVAQRTPKRGAAVDEGEAMLGATLGSYRLLAQLGRGGMGYVYRAEHVHLGREVALKLLRSDYAKRKDAVARFFQEARTVNRVRHRNIVDVTDLVELEDGTTFIIMELLTGLCLSDWARQPLEVPRVLSVLAQICDGLAAAHSVHVVHRDLKPDNVIITRDDDGLEQVKLLDFGVAKLIHREDDDVAVETAAGSVVGTPAYMSPEQAGGLAIDGRSDIYSLGAIMYELFCGQPMFRGRSFGEFVRKHLTEQPPAPRSTPRGARLDPRLEAIILRAIQKDPDRRYQSILELRDAMLSLAATMRAHESGRRTPLPALEPLPPGDERLTASSHSMPARSGHSLMPASASAVSLRLSQQEQRPARSVPWYVWFVGGAVAVGLGVGGATWLAGTEPVEEPGEEPRRAAFELTLESQPSGASVLEEGSAAVVCRTPCALTLPPLEHAGGNVRRYLVRSEGFVDATLAIDLRSSQRHFLVPLVAKLGPQDLAAPTATAEPGESPAAEPRDDQSAPPIEGALEDQVEDQIEELTPLPLEPSRPAPRPRPAPEPRVIIDSELPDIPDLPTPAKAVPAPSAKAAPRTAPAKPVSGGLEAIDRDPPRTPAQRRPAPAPTIDRSETIDPFRANP